MWTSRMGERDLVLECLGRCVAILVYTRCGICDRGFHIAPRLRMSRAIPPLLLWALGGLL
jgi:hypothetical protein